MITSPRPGSPSSCPACVCGTSPTSLPAQLGRPHGHPARGRAANLSTLLLPGSHPARAGARDRSMPGAGVRYSTAQRKLCVVPTSIAPGQPPATVSATRGSGVTSPREGEWTEPSAEFAPTDLTTEPAFHTHGPAGWSPVTEPHVTPPLASRALPMGLPAQAATVRPGLVSQPTASWTVPAEPSPVLAALLWSSFREPGQNGRGRSAEGTRHSTGATRCPRTPWRAVGRGLPAQALPAPRWRGADCAGVPQPKRGTSRQGAWHPPKAIPGHCAAGRSGRSRAALGLAPLPCGCGSARSLIGRQLVI